MTDKVTQAGLAQAKKRNITKSCPKCNSSEIALWAGSGSYDWIIECQGCGFSVHRNSLKATINRWNVATSKSKIGVLG